MFQFFILLTILGLVFVAWDMSSVVLNSSPSNFINDTAQAVFAPLSGTIHSNITAAKNYTSIKTVLIPAIMFILCTGGFAYLILENLRLLRIHCDRIGILRFLWYLWGISLVVFSLLPFIFSIQLLLEGIVFAVVGIAAYIFLFAAFSWIYSIYYKRSC